MSNLRNCDDCGHQVSKRADFCPNCGARFVQRWDEIRGGNILSGLFKFFISVFLILILIVWIVG